MANDMTDDPGIGDETPRERLARRNMEGDLHFLASLRETGEKLGASSRVRKALARHGDDPRLSDLRRYAHSLGLSIRHEYTWRGPHLTEPQGGKHDQ